MNRLTKIAAIAALTCAAPALCAQDVKVKAAIDSVQTLQGTLRQIDIEVVQPKGLALEWSIPQAGANPEEIVELYPSIEIRRDSKVDTSLIAPDVLQLRRTLLVQPWDSGEYLIPAIALTAGADTFLSMPIALKVIPAFTDTLEGINADYMPLATQEPQKWDWVPDWIYDNWWALLIAAVLIAATIIGLIIYYRKRSRRLKPAAAKVRLIPPYEKAMQQLSALKEQKLCEKGREKEFYTSLTEILREYLEGRFGINAMEMTTPQIKRAVYAAVPEKEATKMMGEILEMADYVKFAKMRPLPEDNMRAFRQALDFVENTRPQHVGSKIPGKEVQS